MKTLSKNDFHTWLLRPAIFNGKEAYLKIEFENDYLHRAEISEAELMNLRPGDCAKITARIPFDDDKSKLFGEYITLYMSDSILSEFIEKLGVSHITAKILVRVKLTYAIYNEDDLDYDGYPIKNELIAFNLLELLDT